jgi:hypothetical protein
MSYIQQLNEIRNNIHKEIVFAVIDETKAIDEDFQIELDLGVEYVTEQYRPYNGEVVKRVVTGVDSATSELVGTDDDGNEKLIQYRDVPVERLAEVLLLLKTKKYKTKILA